MASASLAPPSLQSGLIGISDLEALLGVKFVRDTVAFYERELRAARDEFDKQVRTSTLHPLAPVLSEYLPLKSEISRRLLASPSPALIKLAADADAIMAFRPSWDDGPQGRKRKNLVRRLKDPRESLHCIFEFRDAMWLRMLGATVDLRALRMEPGHDIHAELQGIGLELETKVVYPWTGQQIADPVFNKLFNELQHRVHAARLPPMAIRVECSSRLAQEDIQVLADAALRLVLTGRERVGALGKYGISVENMPLSTATPEQIEQMLREYRQARPREHAGIRSQPLGDGRIQPELILTAVSNRSDDLAGAVLEAVKDAASQLSGSTPGIVMVHLPIEISRRLTANDAGPLPRRMGGLFQRGSLKNVTMAGLTWDGSVADRGKDVRIGSPTFQMWNAQPRHALQADLLKSDD